MRGQQGEPVSHGAAIGSVAAKIGGTAETLRRWVRQAEKDPGERAGATTAERERIKALNGRCGHCARPTKSCARVGVLCPGGARPPVPAMEAFIDQYRDVYGVEPIGKVVPIAPAATACRRPGRPLPRADFVWLPGAGPVRAPAVRSRPFHPPPR
ncbi:protein of unknown function [Candidatus Methylocalor cossyra]|uniref:Transposase n=1 Tax=Candidatus Methylocalor cossyra TaxID=3108543 RepID=A0ABP1CCD7_9GAMM